MSRNSIIGSVQLALICVLMSGCATVSAPDPRTGAPVEDRNGGAPPPAAPDFPQDSQARVDDPRSAEDPRSDASQATLALLRESDKAKARGETAAATAYVERAIRLEPRRADLWIELARLALPEKAVAAERYARKALSLAGDRADLTRDAWLVIADAKEAKGDKLEAIAIRDRYRTYRG